MKSKKYPAESELQEKTKLRVKEESVPYGRFTSNKADSGLGISLFQAKRRLSKRAKRSAKEIRWALGIVGIGAGPKDLSENFRAYSRRAK